MRHFILFHGKRHPREIGVAEVHAFLTHLATVKNVAASTQNQALNALVFLYGQVLHQPLGPIGKYARASRPIRLPVVLPWTRGRGDDADLHPCDEQTPPSPRLRRGKPGLGVRSPLDG
jgi:hypothetical protein